MKLLFRIILLSFLIFANKSFSQVNKGKELVYNTCDFTTDGNGKSLGIKLRIPIPCSWGLTVIQFIIRHSRLKRFIL